MVPGIFTVNQSGTGPGAVLNSDYSANRAGNAAARGDYIMVFASMGGENGQDGAMVSGAPAHPLSGTMTAPSAESVSSLKSCSMWAALPK